MQLAHGPLVWRQGQHSPTSLVAKYNGQLAHEPLVWRQEKNNATCLVANRTGN